MEFLKDTEHFGEPFKRGEDENLGADLEKFLGKLILWNESKVFNRTSKRVNWLLRHTDDVINVKDYGAIGDENTDDTTAIQAAFDVSGAKTIYFPPGKTFLVTGLTITTDDCTLLGYNSILKLKVLSSLDGSPIIDNQASNLEIYGLSFDGQKDSQPVDGFNDSYNSGANGTGRAYRAAVIMDRNVTAGISGLLVKDCFFEDIYGACIATNQISKVRILDCVAENNFFELGFLYDLPSTGANKDAIITGNRLFNIKSGHATVNANGFTINNYSHLIIVDNQIRDVDRNFVKIEGGNYITITGNVAENNDDTLGFPFIQVQTDATNVVISNNTCKHFGKGIQFDIGNFSHIAIIGNVLVDIVSSVTGDAIVADGTSFNDAIIANNIISNVMRDGIHIKRCNRVTIANNLIYGHANNIVGVAVRIWLFDNAEDIILRGNTMQNFPSGINNSLIYIIRDAAETLTNLLVQGNIVKSGSSANYAFRIPADMITTGIVSDNYFDGIVQTASSSINWKNNIITGTVSQTIPALANDATPSVVSRSDVYLTGGTTTITDFDDGVTGQVFTAIAEHSLIITDGTNIFLDGSRNWAMAATDTLTLIQKADGKWYEVSRGENVGLAYGEISVVSNATETAIASQNVYVQITIFDTNGENNNATPDHTEDHITITKAGRYFISCSITLNSIGGSGSTAEMEVQKNNGNARVGSLHMDRTLSGGGTESGAITMTGIANLSVNDTIEVWLKNETNTQNYVVEDITLSLMQIGG